MMLKAICDCSTCDACGNAPGRSGYCLNCEVTDSGAEGSHAQHTPGPIDWSTVKAPRAIAATWSDSPRDLEADAAYDEIVRRWEAHEVMLEALRAALEFTNRFGHPNGCTYMKSDHINDCDCGYAYDQIEAALAAAEGPGDTHS